MSSMICFVLHTAIINAKCGMMNSMDVDVNKEVTYLTSNIVSKITFGEKCYESKMRGKSFKEYLDRCFNLISIFSISKNGSAFLYIDDLVAFSKV